jgi:exodeoxyribonuclease-3
MAQTLTIWSWNVENLPRVLASGSSLLARARDCGVKPDLLCCQEVRVRPQDADAVAAMRAAVPGYDCHFSLASDPHNVTYRGGRAYGVATWVRARLGARIEPVAWDREGRLAVSVFDELRLVVVNIYGVNGTSKPYFDPQGGHQVGTRYDWKQRFNRQLAEACAAFCARGFGLVVIGDFNISRERIDAVPRLRTWGPHAVARAQLNDEIIPALGLVDVFRARHPTTRAYTWFNRWSKTLDAARVDYALVSRALAERVTAAEIGVPPQRNAISDHAPLWLRLRVNESVRGQ